MDRVYHGWQRLLGKRARLLLLRLAFMLMPTFAPSLPLPFAVSVARRAMVPRSLPVLVLAVSMIAAFVTVLAALIILSSNCRTRFGGRKLRFTERKWTLLILHRIRKVISHRWSGERNVLSERGSSD